MMNCRKHLRNNIFAGAVLFSGLLLPACGKEEIDSGYAVKVDNTVLSEKDLDEALTGLKSRNKYRKEYINEWIENEIMFREAEEQGLLDEDDFKKTIEQSRKELAKAFLINKLFEENPVQPEPAELRSYYSRFSEDFRLTDNAYRVNTIKFNSEDKAIQFRSTAVESDWNRTLNVFRGDASIIESAAGQVIPKHDVDNLSLLGILDQLNPDEISIVFRTEPSVFEVVQLVEKFDKGYLPKFEDTEELVRQRYTHFRQQEIYRDYVKSLISKHNIVIKKEDE